MKNISEIRQQLSSVLRQTEDFRLEKASAYKSGIMYTIITLIIAVVGIASFTFMKNPIFIIIGIVLLPLAFVVYYFTAFKHQKAYKLQFKSTVLKQIVETVLPGVSYEAMRFIQKTDFNSAQLFSTNSNIYNGEDYFSGTYQGSRFELSELTVQRRTQSTSYSNGKSRTTSSTTTIFKGIFIILHTEKSSYGETYVLPDTAENLFGSFGKFIQKNLGSLVQKGTMIYLEENPEFEKQFVVYSTEEIESRKLLSQNLLQSIMEINERWKIKPSFAFIHNKVFIAVPYRKDLLKVSLHKSLIEDQEEVLQGFVDEIALCMNIIGEISEDLNR